MTPSTAGIGAAIARAMGARAIVRAVYGPFASGDGATIYRVATVDDQVFQITVRKLEAAQ